MTPTTPGRMHVPTPMLAEECQFVFDEDAVNARLTHKTTGGSAVQVRGDDADRAPTTPQLSLGSVALAVQHEDTTRN